MTNETHYPIATLIIGSAVIAAIVFSYEKRHKPGGNIITETLSNLSGAIPTANVLNAKFDPTLNTQGVGVTDTHGSAASVLNPTPFKIDETGRTVFDNSYIEYVQNAPGNLKNLLDLGLGNANIDQSQFAGINYSHVNPSPSIFSSQ